ncbi:RpiB/LacA/LacB family sugar-phosphate isomerase [Candidatus Woesebacteria bacterium]|nr:RpiB/LacA/LacB family sugar-phosphate isomerase [Candidatus Woesebacteria bacterium]
MTVFIGADHNGFALKNTLIDYLHEKNIRIEDLGNYDYDPEDDHPDFAQAVGKAVLQNPDDFRGIVICGSGIGVSIAANRLNGIYCALGFNEEQVKHGRANDHINVLALPAEHITDEEAKGMVDIFLHTEKNPKEKYLRRIKKIDQIQHQ